MVFLRLQRVEAESSAIGQASGFLNPAKTKKGPLGVRGQSALVLSLCESLVAPAFLLRLGRWLRRSTLRGGLRGIRLRRANR
jgi:hypothetical protein